MAEQKVGEVFAFYGKIMVAGVRVTAPLSIGDKIRIKGTSTNVQQDVASMQIDRNPIQKATPGQEIGLKVIDTVKQGDAVFKID